MRLRLVAKDLHLVLIETLLRAELQLGCPILEVHIAHRMPHMLAPVTGLCLLKRSPTTLRETRLRTVTRSIRARQIIRSILGDRPMTPATVAVVCAMNRKYNIVNLPYTF